ncbi:MAG: 4-hydroxy-tetrahydrodipicolinate synthase [bacterium]|nr:4-hydroxy-tetrahydrodipicolinate synthase [bacterium]
MFTGCMVALVTPFKNGEVNFEEMGSLIDWQIDQGADGIVPCGTTGESATLSLDEHKEIIKFVVKKVDRRVPVVAGAGSNNTKESLELLECAKRERADGALIICPYYNKPTQEGIYQHYKYLAESVDIPIVLYNIPSRTGINIDPHTIKRLSHINNIVGIKEASGNINQASAIIDHCKDDLTLVSGEDSLILPLLSIGGKGVISATANIVAKDMSLLIRKYFSGNINVAKDLHFKLLPICHNMFIETNPAPVKEALYQMEKISSPEVRLPLVTLREENKEQISKVLSSYGLI